MRSHASDESVGKDHERKFHNGTEDSRNRDHLFRCAQLGKKYILELKNTTVEKAYQDHGDRKAQQRPVMENASQRSFNTWFGNSNVHSCNEISWLYEQK
jgi:hypothetical protein